MEEEVRISPVAEKGHQPAVVLPRIGLLRASVQCAAFRVQLYGI